METAGTYTQSHSLKCWHSKVGLFPSIYMCRIVSVYTGTLTISKLHKLSVAYSTADIAYASLNNVAWPMYTQSTLSQAPVCKWTGNLLFYFRFLPASISYWLCSIIIHGELRTMVFCPLSLRNILIKRLEFDRRSSCPRTCATISTIFPGDFEIFNLLFYHWVNLIRW